jgi:hypothetical protein
MAALKYFLIGLLLTAVTYAVGEVHGKITNRYGLRPDVELAGKRLEQMPTEFGDWKLERNDGLSKQTKRILECTGSLSQVYHNTKTDDIVTVAVMLGPSGPIAVHTPEICYSSREFKITNERKKWQLPAKASQGTVAAEATARPSTDEFWDLRLQSNKVNGSALRVLYAWTNNQQWQAADMPRFSYAGSPYLYKIQLAGSPPLDENQRDACAEFLTEFLPILRAHMLEGK